MSDKQPPASAPEPPPANMGIDPVEDTLGGGGIRGEVAGCPTGLARSRPLPERKKERGVEEPPPGQGGAEKGP